MKPETSMLSAEEDIRRIAAPTDRRPEFIAEALSPRFRVGLLLATLLTELGLVACLATATLSAGSLLGSGLFGVLLGAATLVMTFVLFLVYGNLVSNNSRLSTRGRTAWLFAFLVAGPVTVPLYWLMHVRPTPFEPLELSSDLPSARPAQGAPS
jgi:uncharacterized membrane protein YedE/YeeE